MVMMLLFAVSACPVQAASKKSQIKKVVKTYMAGARKTSAKKMSKVIKSPGHFNFTLNQALRAVPYFRDVFKSNTKIKYKIQSIRTVGKKARVTVRVLSPNIKTASEKAWADLLSYYSKNPKLTEDQVNTYFYNSLENNISKYGVQMYRHTMVFNMTKTGGRWKINTSSDADYDLIYGNFLTIYKEILKK